MAITIRHRNKVEVLKFTQITNFQAALGLADLIGPVSPPESIRIWHVLWPWKNNVALFILRLHFVLGLFAVVFAAYRSLQ